MSCGNKIVSNCCFKLFQNCLIATVNILEILVIATVYNFEILIIATVYNLEIPIIATVYIIIIVLYLFMISHYINSDHSFLYLSTI